jgi:photosystem II stability/assembly factor-like uncharacterized protein
MNRSYRLALAAPFAVALWLISPAAGANGRFPAADQLLIDPSDPKHIVARTTFGFVESRDGGKQWVWTCEEIIGKIASEDPPFAVSGDGSVVVAVPFEGVSVTHDHGCTWTRAPAPLLGQLAVDVTLDPSDLASLVVLTSTNDTSPDAGPNAPQQFLNLVVETKDNGVTWGLRGVPLARDFIAATIEIARSDPNRIYASGVFGEPRQAGIERSEDGGKTWTRTLVPSGSDLGSVYISAVDAQNADRLFVRVLRQADIATNRTPTTLLESTDKGSSWREVATTDESMLGFALSPDGTQLAYGTIGQGVFLGPSDGSAPLAKVSDVQNRCLTWSAAGLYACGTDLGRDPPATMSSAQPPQTFAIGLSHDLGKSYDTLFKLFQTCPATCPDESRFNTVCRTVWQMKPGITTATAATGEMCTVPWAKTTAPEGGSSGAGGTGGTGGSGGDRDAGPGPGPNPPAGESCSCRLATVRKERSSAGAWQICFAAIAYLARTRGFRRRFLDAGRRLAPRRRHPR